MRFRSSLWFGFTIGFLFGVLGLWILSMLSLALPVVELLSQPLFALGRSLSAAIATDGSMGNLGVAFLTIVNGVFYGLIGVLIQWGVRRLCRA